MVQITTLLELGEERLLLLSKVRRPHRNNVICLRSERTARFQASRKGQEGLDYKCLQGSESSESWVLMCGPLAEKHLKHT